MLKVFFQLKHALLVPPLQDGSAGVGGLSQQRFLTNKGKQAGSM